MLASGGLSHFVVDEELDRTASSQRSRARTPTALAALDPKQLQAGSSEIRNWMVVAEVVKDLDLDWVRYVPGYRTSGADRHRPGLRGLEDTRLKSAIA